MVEPIDTIDEITEQNAYLDSRNASKYLNIRSTEISIINPLSLSSKLLRNLIQNDRLRSTRIGNSGPFLFKIEWLEDFLKKEYKEEYIETDNAQEVEYVSELNQVNIAEPGPLESSNEPIRSEPPAPVDLLGLANHSTVHERQGQNNNAGFLDQIKNSPPLIYSGAAVCGFLFAVSIDAGERLYSTGLFSKNTISLSQPMDKKDRVALFEFVDSQSADSDFGKKLRDRVINLEGPFSSIKKTVRVYLIDPSIHEESQSILFFVKKNAAVVCVGSRIAKHRIRISGKDIINAQGIVDVVDSERTKKSRIGFNAFLEDSAACIADTTNIIVNRAFLEEEFRVGSGIVEYIDVTALIELH